MMDQSDFNSEKMQPDAVLRGAKNAIAAFMKQKGFDPERRIGTEGAEVSILDAVMDSVQDLQKAGLPINPETVAPEVRNVLNEVWPSESRPKVGSMYSGPYDPHERNQGEWDREFVDFIARKKQK